MALLVETVVPWPTSTRLCVADRVPAERTGSTVSEKVFATAPPLESVTITCTVYGLAELDVGVQMNDAAAPLQPGGSPDHKYEVYVPDPPDALADMVVAWPTSTGLWVAEVAAVITESTVRERVAVAVLLLPSATVRVTVKGVPATDDGVQLTEAESELLHPDGRPDQE